MLENHGSIIGSTILRLDISTPVHGNNSEPNRKNIFGILKTFVFTTPLLLKLVTKVTPAQ